MRQNRWVLAVAALALASGATLHRLAEPAGAAFFLVYMCALLAAMSADQRRKLRAIAAR